MQAEKHVRLFKNGRNQAVRIPREFELQGNEAVIRREGDRLIIEAVRRRSLLAMLAGWEPLPEEFPDVDEKLMPLEDIEL
ncbi:MAG: AbrB/MazE/SpoVT family DNA-binding domain-containing protein [Desulfurivibrionaceae bacterium]